jgi:osmotically inducible protein OsmC
MAARKGSAEWKGDLKGGAGTLTVGEGAWNGSYSFSSRFEEGEGTNPEELIAAAHASCYAMALSNALATAGTPPESIKAEAGVQLRRVDDAPTIAQIDLDVVGVVPGIDEAAFAKAAEEAKQGCPVSRALAGVPEINLNARLA